MFCDYSFMSIFDQFYEVFSPDNKKKNKKFAKVFSESVTQSSPCFADV